MSLKLFIICLVIRGVASETYPQCGNYDKNCVECTKVIYCVFLVTKSIDFKCAYKSEISSYAVKSIIHSHIRCNQIEKYKGNQSLLEVLSKY
jgi:hypothetical protein